MQEAAGLDEIGKLQKINEFFNTAWNIAYVNDIDNWGKSDYWANRYESLGKGRGDCEDYVIAKYFTLKELGVNPNKLFFVFVTIARSKEVHMVLAYYENKRSIPLILDSMNINLLPANKRPDLGFVFSFNVDTDDAFMTDASSGGAKAKVNKENYTTYRRNWQNLLQKMNKEGL